MHGIRPPNWNSLDAVQTIHGTLELVAILLFGLLVFVDILEHVAREPKRQVFLRMAGFVVFAAAILTELAAYPYSRRADTLSNRQIHTDEQIISKLSGDVIVASTHADDAANAANSANGSAKQAEQQATNAQAAARGARKEADSFEADIVTAKKQAAAAESDLAGARQRAADALKQAAYATAELERIKARRSLTNIPAIMSSLKGFENVEYAFNGVSLDDDSENLLDTIDSALQKAGWKRVNAPCGLPSVRHSFEGASSQVCISLAVSDGVRVSVEYPEGSSGLRTISLQNAPQYIRAATSLYFLIKSGLSPAEESPGGISVAKGTAGTIFISVGKKD
ncbi:MAG TPA: hypothetical protein VFW94_00470 [Candidatus Acidoferrales bacterium]|nr:hypothetical protein [Candidatus Acidoferrales bacterium]